MHAKKAGSDVADLGLFKLATLAHAAVETNAATRVVQLDKESVPSGAHIFGVVWRLRLRKQGQRRENDEHSDYGA